MFKKWSDTWSSFPPLHKKRFYQGVAAYGLLVILVGTFVWSQADVARKEWQDRRPQAEAPVKTIYLTPQLTEASPSIDFGTGEKVAVGPARGYISIIMSEAGLDDALTKRAIEDLPPEVAIAFSPYSTRLKEWIAEAKAENREALVLLPMEPTTYPKDDPGPKALLTRLSDLENANSLAEILASAEGSVGVMSFMGSRFLTDEDKLSPVFESLQKRGVVFVETPGVARSVGEILALRAKLSYFAADLQIDARATDIDVKQQLLTLEKIALLKGYAVGVAQPYPVTFNLLKKWSEDLESRGVKLVPLSNLWQVKQNSDKKTPLSLPTGQQQEEQ